MKSLSKYVAPVLIPLAFTSQAYSSNPVEPNQEVSELETKAEEGSRRERDLLMVIVGSVGGSVGFTLGYLCACLNERRR